MARNVTMLDLVTELSRHGQTEREVIDTVVQLVNSGAVRLSGSFKGQRLEVDGEEEEANSTRALH